MTIDHDTTVLLRMKVYRVSADGRRADLREIVVTSDQVAEPCQSLTYPPCLCPRHR